MCAGGPIRTTMGLVVVLLLLLMTSERRAGPMVTPLRVRAASTRGITPATATAAPSIVPGKGRKCRWLEIELNAGAAASVPVV